MTDPDLIRLFIAPLEELEIRYMITGGVAAVMEIRASRATSTPCSSCGRVTRSA